MEFVYSERHKVVICRICKHAVASSQLRRHLQDNKIHSDTSYSSEGWQRITGELEGKSTVSIAGLHIPSTTVPCIDGLVVFVDGFMCNSPNSDCRFISRRIDEIKRHCRQKHGWINPNVKNRARKTNHDQDAIDNPWTASVKCQQFFKTGPKSQLFKVGLPEEEEASQEIRLVHRAGTQESDWERRSAGYRQYARNVVTKAEKDNRDLVHKPVKGEVNPWVDRTGWAVHLEGQKRRKLVQLIAKPDRDSEPELVEIARRLDKIVSIAQTTVIKRVNTFTRMEIKRKDVNTTEKRPFNAHLEDDTRKRYCNEFKCVVWYILRVWLYDQRKADEASSVNSDNSEGSSSDESDSDSSSETGSEVGARTPPLNDPIRSQQHRFPKKLPRFQMKSTQEQLTRVLVAKVQECTAEGVELEEVGEEEDEEIQSGRLDRVNRILVR